MSRIVFDDFGTGYGSLSYLKKFPLDGLKIDRSFVLELLADSDDAAIVGSTIGLSKQLGLSVIAEGIENRATADLLASMGCEEGQGYFFGRPMPAGAFESQFLTAPESTADLSRKRRGRPEATAFSSFRRDRSVDLAETINDPLTVRLEFDLRANGIFQSFH